MFIVHEDAISICLSVIKVTLIDISIGMSQSTLGAEHAVLGDTLIGRAVFVFDFSDSCPD